MRVLRRHAAAYSHWDTTRHSSFGAMHRLRYKRARVVLLRVVMMAVSADIALRLHLKRTTSLCESVQEVFQTLQNRFPA